VCHGSASLLLPTFMYSTGDGDGFIPLLVCDGMLHADKEEGVGMVMDDRIALSDPESWALGQFGTAKLGDARRTKRLVKLAGQMAMNSSGSIPQQTGNAADMKAAYRLFAKEDVTHEAICRPHFERTRTVASQRPWVFMIQDNAQLNYTSHTRCEGLGPIGRGEMRGLQQQNVLAVDPTTRAPLGLMYQKHPCRAIRSKGHNRTAKRKVPLAERESYWWIEAIRSVGPPPPGVQWVHVGDRAEDLFGVYDECRRQRGDWLIRAGRNRKVLTPTGPDHLMHYARGLPGMTSRTLEVRDRKLKTTRQATVSVAAGPVTFPPTRFEPAYAEREPIRCWVVRAWEPHPPSGAGPLEWILLTSLPCEKAEMTLLAAQGYSLRWLIEEFHKCEKTGCRVEARELGSVDRLEPLIGLLSVLAVRLLQLKYVARDRPEQPARELFDDQMVEVMARYLKRPARGLTVGAFWRGIGRLGGHVGRKCDGPLGWLRAWRGWQRFQLILIGAELYAERAREKCG